VQADDALDALLVVGSFAGDSADEASDLDLMVAVSAGQFEEAWAQVRAASPSVRDLLGTAIRLRFELAACAYQDDVRRSTTSRITQCGNAVACAIAVALHRDLV
jgi:predicted nucleotidyltransferase